MACLPFQLGGRRSVNLSAGFCQKSGSGIRGWITPGKVPAHARAGAAASDPARRSPRRWACDQGSGAPRGSRRLHGDMGDREQRGVHGTAGHVARQRFQLLFFSFSAFGKTKIYDKTFKYSFK